MKKKIILIIFFLLIIISGLILINKYSKKQSRVCFKDNCFDVEIALTPQEKSQGLMFRESLDLDKGILFVYEKSGKYSFWMKNLLFPLDIIWIDENNGVVFISENTLPCKSDPCPSVKSDREAKYVLEINGGLSEKIGLAVGDRLEISF